MWVGKGLVQTNLDLNQKCLPQLKIVAVIMGVLTEMGCISEILYANLFLLVAIIVLFFIINQHITRTLENTPW